MWIIHTSTKAEALQAAKTARKSGKSSAKISKTLGGYKVTVKGKTENPTALVKGFIPVQVVGGNLIGKVTNPGQKKAFKRLVSKIKKALK